MKAVFFCLFSLFITIAHAQDNSTLTIKGQTLLKARPKAIVSLNSGIKNAQYKESSMDGVDIEVKKNGVTILKITSEKKGKYSFEIPVSTTDAKNDYIVYFTKEGMAPRMVYVNAYLPKEEYTKYPSQKYVLEELVVPLFETTLKDVLPDKFAQVKWDKVKLHKFTLDETFARFQHGEEQKIQADPDKYYASLAKKKTKQEEALAKSKAAADAKLKAAEDAKKKAEEEARKKADELARLKAEADAKKLADQRAKEEADRLAQEQASLKISMRKKRIADSLAEIERKKAMETSASATMDIKKTVKPVEANTEESTDENKDPYDVSGNYSISIARRSVNAEKEKKSREKGRNLSAKYETTNVLTSLLNMVDEDDRRSKKQ